MLDDVGALLVLMCVCVCVGGGWVDFYLLTFFFMGITTITKVLEKSGSYCFSHNFFTEHVAVLHVIPEWQR